MPVSSFNVPQWYRDRQNRSEARHGPPKGSTGQSDGCTHGGCGLCCRLGAHVRDSSVYVGEACEQGCAGWCPVCQAEVELLFQSLRERTE